MKVRYCKAQGQTPVGNRISHRITQISRQLRLSVDKSGAGLAISHPSPLQNIKCVLPLVKEKTRRTRLNSDAQEVVELTQILHSKFLLQRGDDTLKQPLTKGCEHNVINVEQIGSLIPTAVDEERRRVVQRKTEGEGCKGAPCYHTGGADAGRPNPLQ